MSEFILSACSTADIKKEHFEKRNINYICFHYNLGGIDYMDDLGQSVPFNEFYARMVAGEDTRTSQINVDEYNVVVAEVKGTKDIGLLLKLEGAKDGKWIEKTFTLTGEKQVIKWAVPTENLTRGTSDIKLLFSS